MDIFEYQAKKIFKNFNIPVPTGSIAYTPEESKEVALGISKHGPWVIKAQIRAGSRNDGKFIDMRAGKKGGIRLSKTINEVFQNTAGMLENMLVTNQTGDKGRLVSRVYIEEYVQTYQKFYLGLVVDRISASVILLITILNKDDESNIVNLSLQHPETVLKINLGVQKRITSKQLEDVINFIDFSGETAELRKFINNALRIFFYYNATMIEINPVGITKKHRLCALDAKIVFDDNALYRHSDILKLTNETDINEREIIAAKFGFQYKEIENGIGIICNGNGLALNIISEAKKQGLKTACFLNLKGGVDRDKIAASIRLIMTDPKVDGIFINIIGGFSRCNLIADGIISVANDLGLNIPLVARFEGTNKEDAIHILHSSGLPLQIATNTHSGLTLLKQAIEEDL